MLTDLKAQLQGSFGDAYVIERELSGGGMSRVFLAEEVALRRKVVVKVLLPDFAATVNAERFRREIQLAARLQHPHIVPLLSAGVSEGLPYFTMPFIEGESLRDRLARSGEMPIHDIVRILKDILSALSYAHAHGVIHRDIKPDNVLLTGQHAVVVDFGVAKALDASTDAPSALTSGGVALGTPAYMAPEQAAADPMADQRVDLYAVGAIAYEMLTGQQVFRARTPQALFVAHALDEPEPIEKRRPSVPPTLSSLVMRSLRKHPADRPQSATEMMAELETESDTGRTAIRGQPDLLSRAFWRRLRPTIVATAAAALIGTAATYWYAQNGRGDNDSQIHPGSRPAEPTSRRVLTGTFQNRSGDSRLAYLSPLTEDRIARRITAANVADVLPRSDSALTTRDAVRAAKLAGAVLFLTGSILQVGSSVELRADIINPLTSEVVRSVGPVSRDRRDATAAVDELVERVTGTIALMLDPVMADAIPPIARQTPTYAAFREMAVGEGLANEAQFFQAGVAYLRSLHVDSTFTFAAVRAVRGYLNSGHCEKAESLAQRFLEPRDRLSEYEHAAIQRTLARCRGDMVTAYQSASRMVSLAPGSNDARRALGASALYLWRPREALSVLQKLQTNGQSPGPADLWIMTRALHLLNRHEEELRLADSCAREYPVVQLCYTIRLNALAALGDTVRIELIANELGTDPQGTRNRLGSALSLIGAANELTRHGHPSTAQKVALRAIEVLDATPASGRDVPFSQVRAEAAYVAKRWSESRTLLESLLRQDSTDEAGRGPQIDAGGSDLSVADNTRALLGMVDAREGQQLRAEAALRAFLRMSGPYLSGQNTLVAARIAALLGRRDEAVRLLRDSMLQGQTPVTGTIETLPEFENLRGYKPFEDLFVPRG